MESIYHIDGSGNFLEVFDDRCTITGKKGFSGIMARKNAMGCKVFYYKDITSVQYMAPRFRTDNGYIQFDYAGVVTPANLREKWYCDNVFMINFKYREEGQKVYEFVLGKVQSAKDAAEQKTVVQSLSSADEIKKYKDLLDQGIITQEEFDTKKKQLLGL